MEFVKRRAAAEKERMFHVKRRALRGGKKGALQNENLQRSHFRFSVEA